VNTLGRTIFCISFLGGAVACDSDSREPALEAGAAVRSARGGEDLLGGAGGSGFRIAGPEIRTEEQTHAAVLRDGALTVTPRHWDGTQALRGAPIELATAEIRRGQVDLDAGLRGTRLDDEGAILLDRGTTVERLEGRDDGVEQSWRFDTEPQGEGALDVLVAASGHEMVEASASGLHFMTPGRLGLRYTHATWVDADGEAWRVPVSWDGAFIAMHVPAEVLDASRYPAVLDPVISGEVGVDVHAAGYSGAHALEPAVAWSGSQYLVVWRDDSAGLASDVRAARVAADGSIVDRISIVVTGGLLAHTEPSVAWTGSQWLVAWTQDDVDVHAATVGTDGSVTSLGALAATAVTERRPDVASDGAGALVVWQAGGNLEAARFDGTGFAAPFTVAATAAPEEQPTVAAAPGGGYLVAWESGDPEDLRAQLVTSGGALSGAAFDLIAAAGPQTTPDAAFDGTDFLVAWNDGGDIRGARVSTAGAVLDAGGLSIAVSANAQYLPAVACDAASCMVAWHERVAPDDDGVFGQRVDFTLASLGGQITINDRLRNQRVPALAATATGFLAAWQDHVNGPQTIVMTPIAGDGAVSDAGGIVLNVADRATQDTPAYARHAGGQLAIWSDSRVLGDDVLARRYDANGTRVDTSSFQVSTAAHDQTTPAVDFDGTQYVAVWADARGTNYDVYAARFGQDGTLSDPAGIPVSLANRHQIHPDVASGGGVSLLVWQDRQTGTSYDLMGAVLAPNGTLGATFPICAGAAEERQASAVWDPASSLFVVAWADSRAGDDEDDIYAARVTTNGDVREPCGVQVTARAFQQVGPAMAVSGGQILLAWTDYQDDEFGDIVGARLDTSGDALNVLATDVPLVTGASAQMAVTAVGLTGAAGLGWGLAWVDDRNMGASGTDIYGNTVGLDGSLAGPDYLISGGVGNEANPSFEAGVNATVRAFLVYERRRPDLGSTRVMRRRLRYP
jgi:hypothetical protein